LRGYSRAGWTAGAHAQPHAKIDDRVMETLPEHQRPLRDLFSSLRDRRFLFVRTGGNWGDHLIYLGAESLASEIGLTWRTLEFDEFMAEPAGQPGDVIYINGGGGFTKLASGRATHCFRKAFQTPGALVINGPCTVADGPTLGSLRPEILARRADRVVFFSRERKSAEIAADELPSGVEQFLNEDTAFYLNRDMLRSRAGRIRQRANLIGVREDSESVKGRQSASAFQSVIDPAYFAQTFDHWLRVHAASKTILTNRTHSAVCGAILGTPTTLFDGAYHKNKSIWEFSLEKRSVKWLSDFHSVPTRPSVDPFLAWIPFAFIRRSWRLDRIAKGLRGIPLS
jgi:exopolysaccharide biosynthesis predicted pyruvyltransferase EpsI